MSFSSSDLSGQVNSADDEHRITVLENTSPVIADLDCGEGENPDLGKDICAVTHKEMNGFGEDTEKPTSYILSLGDLNADLVTLATDQDDIDKVNDKVEVGDLLGADDSDSYLIRVSKDSDPSKTDNLFFEGMVDKGDSFEASGSFGSETFVHIFDDDGNLLQTINFHTSCSSPLIIGDQYGSITLEGATLEGKDTGTTYTVGATETDGDEGVIYSIDETYRDGALFQVNDNGEVTFINAPDYEDPQDIGGDNKYEVKVLCEVDGKVEEKILEVCVEDDCINILENTSPVIADLDCGEGENPDLGKDICAVTHKEMNGFGEDTEKPTSYILSLGDLSDKIVTSATGDAANKVNDKVSVEAYNPGAADDTNFYVVVSDESDPAKAAASSDAFFAGSVDQGNSFEASGSFGSETFVHIFASQGGALATSINFHTSCSSPLIIGDQYGSITLEGATLEGKDTGTFYAVGQTETDGDTGVVYYITGGDGFVEGMADDPTDNSSTIFEVDEKTGEVTFINAPDFENPQDANGDNKYDVEVTAYKLNEDGTLGEVCEVKPLEVCVEDDCINILENTSPVIADLDCGEGDNPDAGTDICMLTHKEMNGFGEDTEKPSSYTLSLGDLSAELVTSDTTGKVMDKVEVGALTGTDDGNGSYYVLVSDQSDPAKALTDNFFAGTVEQGENFEAAGSFGSETFVHIYSGQGGSLLQTINFHTSCSSPLIIGDQYGSITLEGATLEGKDSGTFYTVGQTETDGDAGVIYEITQNEFDSNGDPIFQVDPDTGEVTFINPPDFDNPFGDNPDNKYDIEVTAFFVDANGVKSGEICEVKPLEICVEDQDCIEINENTIGPVADLDSTVECEVEAPGGDMGLFVCQAIDDQGLEKPSELTLTLGDMIDPKVSDFQPDGKSSVLTTGAAEDGDGLLRVIVSDDEDPTKLDTVYFNGEVSFGESFTALASNAGDDKFSSNTYVHILDDDGTLLQTIQYHTSCSAPIVIGDQVGSLTVTGVGALNNDTGQVVTFGGTTMMTTTLGEGDIVYSIVGGDDAAAFTVDSETGEVSFINPPDFEASSLDGDDNYEVIVRATAKDDPTCFTDTPVEICVKDVPELGSIAGRYFCDLNDDSLDNNGDKPESGVKVFLQVRNVDGTISFVGETETDENGEYLFDDLPAGEYRVIFAPVEGKVFVDPNIGQVGDVDPADDSDVVAENPITGRGATDFINLAPGENRTDIDAGVEFTASLGDFVFEDANANGLQDTGEAGIAGVTVTLTGGGADGVIGTPDDTTDTTATAADGSYAFTGLNPGEEYQVSFATPAGFTEVSPANEGGDDTLDSDGLVAPIVTLTSGEDNDTIDQGFYNLASLGDRVFEDTNGDGIQDGGEPGVPGVTVELLDGDGNLVATETTDANGDYLFDGLEPGDYQVRFTPPAGFQFTDPNQGGDDTADSDADPTTGLTQTVTLVSGENNLTLDAGLVQTASLGDFVFEDADADGIQDAGEAGIEGVTVTLTGGGADGVIGTPDDTTDTTATAADGSYAFTGLNPGEEYQVSFATPAGFTEVSPANEGGDDTLDSDGLVAPIVTLTSGEDNDTIDQGFYNLASLGDRVFEDTNGDGIQDGGEPGVPGVTVELLDGDGNLVATETTDANGDYLFDGLEPGDYQVRFTPPAGFQFTDPNQGGDDTADSDADPTTGLTQTVTLVSGENNLTLDAGLVQTASLGDFVFEDADADGIQDAGEAGIEGVTVTLTGGGADGVIGTPDDTTDTTATAADGSYAFTGLNPGEEYQVSFATPAGFTEVSPANEGGDDTLDSDGLVAPIVTLTSGEDNDTIDQGFYNLASLGDRVFEDTNGDGIQDGGEPGVPGVTVELLDGDGNLVATETTDANGDYLFDGLEPGDYQVRFTPPAGFQFTDPNQGGDDTADSDADPTTGLTQTVTLVSGENNLTLDAGLVQTASLGDFVFEDADADGIQDAGEAGIEGVTVTLTGGGADGVIGTPDDTTDTTATAADGSYAFTGLNPGEEYQVSFATPAGFTEVSPANEGGDDTLDSDGLVAPIVTLTSGEDNDTIDQGFYNLASLGDRVFEDTNGDGIQDGGEPGVPGVTVELLDGDGNLVATETTDANGDYLFDGLEPGDYQVRFTPPAGFQFTDPNQGGDDTADSDADPTTGLTQTVTLVSGENNLTLDAGLVQTASLGDFVFEDADADGIQDAGEAGIEGVTVTLTGGGADGVIGTPDDTTDTTATAADGSYAFTGLNPGEEYQVSFATPAGFTEVSPANEGGDDTLDSDGLVAPIVTLTSGEDNDTIDQGFYNLASLGDRVFEDTNGDGIQDGGEPGVPGVTVELLDGDGNLVATETTDANGDYLFDGLEPGDYQVRFTPPAGFQFTDPNQGGDDTADSDADPTTGLTQTVTLVSGENNLTLDAGLVQTASLGDFVFEDADADGIQDAGEAGIEGVTVTLTGGGADGVIGTPDDTTDTTATAADGSYAFTGLNPGEEYQVSFATPAGFTEVSPANEGGDDTLDSDGLVAPIVTLTSGEDNDTIDQGFYNLASLGDRVFEDTNGDGIQDGGEPGVPGVTVELLDGDGNLVATETTDANGDYLFDGLEPGDYQVRFTPPAGFQFTDPNQGGDDTADSDADPTTGLTQTVTLVSGENNLTLDAGLVQTASLGDFVFEDADADGIQDAGEAGIEGVTVTLTGGGADGVIGTPDDTTDTTATAADGSYAFTGLNPGEEYQVSFATPAGFTEVSPANEGGDDTLDSDGLVAPIVTLTSGEDNDTIDQGFYNLASLGDRVFEDTNGDGIQDGGEPGVPGVTVELLDGDGNLVATETTDANGDYLFDGLEPGDYQVRFTPPAGFQFTDPNQGGDDTADSDADPTTGLTQTVTLVSGENNLTLDAGLVQTASLGDFVFEDADADGIQDAGEAGIEGVKVTLTGGGADGVIGTPDDTTDTTATAADGSYAFTGLNPGEEYQVSFATPAGFTEVSPANEGGDDTLDSDGLVAPIVTLTSGEDNDTIDQGFYNLASLGDRVFEDTNGDGIQGAGEPGVDGVEVQLKDENGTVIATTTTANGGAYSFTGLTPGTYSVAFIAPAGFAFTVANAGGDDALDSDANPTNGMTQQVTLTSGEFNGTLDAGVVALNTPPEANPDALKLCADEVKSINILANDTDVDGDMLTVDEFVYLGADGVAGGGDDVTIASDGTPTTLATGALVTFDGSFFTYDVTGADSFDGVLGLGAEAVEKFAYTVSDGEGGVSSAAVDVTVCGTASIETVSDLLAGATVEFKVDISFDAAFLPNAFTLELLSSTSGDIPLGTYTAAYCFDQNQLIGTGVVTTANVLVLTETNAALVDLDSNPINTDNIDAVNWLLNNDYTQVDDIDGQDGKYTDLEVQEAIWTLLNGDVYYINQFANRELQDNEDGVRGLNDQGVQESATLENIQEIVDAALANGEGFVPGDGDVFGLILDPTGPDGQDQPFIIGVEYECFC